MSAGILLAIVILSWFVIRAAVLPLLQRYKPKGRGKIIAYAMILGGLKACSRLLVIACATYGLVWSVVILIRNIGDASTAAGFNRLLTTMSDWSDLLETLSSGWTWFTMTVAAAALLLLFLNIRKARRQVNAAYKAAYERLTKECVDQIIAEKEGKIPPLEPSPAMREIQMHILKIDASREALIASAIREGQSAAAAEAEIYMAIQSLNERYVHFDLYRRVQLHENEIEEEIRQQIAAYNAEGSLRNLRPLAIRPLLRRALSFGSDLTSSAAFVAIFLGVLGSAAPLVGTAIEARLCAADDQRAKLTADQADREFNNTVQTNSQARPLTAQEHAQINRVARRFEEAMSRSDVWVQRDAKSSEMRRAQIRKDILDHFVAGDSRKYLAATFGSTDTPNEELNLVTASNNDNGDAGPRTVVGKKYSDWVEKKVALVDPDAARELIKAGDDELSRASADWRGLFIEQISSVATDAGVGSSLSEAAKEILADSGAAALDSAFETQFKQFTVAAIRNKSIAAAARQLSGYDSANPPVARYRRSRIQNAFRDADAALASAFHLADQPPALRATPAVDRVDDLSAKIRAWKDSTLANEEGFSLTDAIAGYDDMFPPALGAELDTERAKVAINVFGTTAADELATKAARNYSRARDPDKLDGFFKVGGIVIGRSADNDLAALNIHDLQWQVNQGRLRLTLLADGGKCIALSREFRPTFVRQALAYAADGRQTAVTIINVKGTNRQRVFLHPALVDTEFGAEVINADKFVFDYVLTQDRKDWKTEDDRINAQLELYDFAFDIRCHQRASKVGMQLRMPFPNEPHGWLEAIRSAGVFKPSPLLDRPEIFDPALVKAIQRTIEGQLSFNDFVAAIQTEDSKPAPSSESEEAAKKYILENMPPRYSVVSGIRDSTFVPSADVGWVQLPPRSQIPSGIAPLEFIAQVAFEPSSALTDAKAPVQAIGPWKFPGFQPKILADAIIKHLASSPQDLATFEDLREFTVLQRLFRMALAGRLAKDFPLERLSELAGAVESAVDPIQTQRWEGDSPLPDTIPVEAKELFER